MHVWAHCTLIRQKRLNVEAVNKSKVAWSLLCCSVRYIASTMNILLCAMQTRKYLSCSVQKPITVCIMGSNSCTTKNASHGPSCNCTIQYDMLSSRLSPNGILHLFSVLAHVPQRHWTGLVTGVVEGVSYQPSELQYCSPCPQSACRAQQLYNLLIWLSYVSSCRHIHAQYCILMASAVTLTATCWLANTEAPMNEQSAANKVSLKQQTTLNVGITWSAQYIAAGSVS